MTSQKERNCFILYHNFANQFALLSLEDRGRLITAIFEYTRTGQLSEDLPAIVNMAFSCMKDTLDRDHEAYLAKCEKNTESGKKGGRPSKRSLLPETERFFEKPKKADKDKDMDMDMGMDKDMGRDKEKEFDNDIYMDRGKDKEKDKEKDREKDREKEWDREIDRDENRRSVQQTEARPAFPPTPSPASRPEEEEEKQIWGSEEETLRLRHSGIPDRYINERRERARAYGAMRGLSAEEVLLLWWEQDKLTYRPEPSASRSAFSSYRSASYDDQASCIPYYDKMPKTYDVDEFFRLAVERSEREWEELQQELQQEEQQQNRESE